MHPYLYFNRIAITVIAINVNVASGAFTIPKAFGFEAATR
jgi:hypothetical protein